MASESGSRVAPPVMKGDRIVPMHLFDDTLANNHVFLSLTLCFDKVLDPDRIHSALVRLLQIGEWRKLGGRLHRQSSGKLEIHIPESFTDARPPVHYYHERFDCSIHDHPITSLLPQGGRLANTTDRIDKLFEPLVAPPDGPRNLADFLSHNDEPQLSLRINSFRDATLVSWNFLHNLSDGSSMGTILQAWSNVINGKEDQVPTRIGAFEDTFAKFSSTIPKEQLLFADKLSGLETKPYTSTSNVWDALESAKTKSKTIFMHKRVLDKIRRDAMADLSAGGFPPEAAMNSDPSKPFLSDGDVILAWLCRHALAKLAPATSEPVTIANSYDTRGRIPAAFSSFDASGKQPVYVGNATLRGYMYVPSSLVTDAPLGEFAAALRSQLVKQTTPEQVHARVALDNKILTSAEGARASFVEAGSTRIFFTNWSRADLYGKADFTGAIVQPDAGDKSSKAGLVHYIHTQAIGIAGLPLNVFQFTGRDHEGNYWLGGGMTLEAWESLEKELAVLNKFGSL